MVHHHWSGYGNLQRVRGSIEKANVSNRRVLYLFIYYTFNDFFFTSFQSINTRNLLVVFHHWLKIILKYLRRYIYFPYWREYGIFKRKPNVLLPVNWKGDYNLFFEIESFGCTKRLDAFGNFVASEAKPPIYKR